MERPGPHSPRDIVSCRSPDRNLRERVPVDGVYLNNHEKVVVVLEMGDPDLTLELDLVELVPEER